MVSRSHRGHDGNGQRKPVSPLRQQMIDDMNLAGLSQGTQDLYIGAVVQLQSAYGTRPDLLTEAEVRRYLVDLRTRAAKGTFQAKFFGIKFFFYRVLNLDWSLFSKKRWHCPGRSVFLLCYPSRIAAA